MSTERLSGMQLDVMRVCRETALNLRKECKESIEQSEAGLITLDEMARYVEPRIAHIQEMCIQVGGAVL